MMAQMCTTVQPEAFVNTPRGTRENKYTLFPASRDRSETAEVKGPHSLHKCPSGALQISHTHTHTHTHRHTLTHPGACLHTHSHLGMYKHVCARALIHVGIVTLAHMNTLTYVCTLTHTHTR